MSSRTRLPTPFFVGILSAVVLGIVWGIVYLTLSAPPGPQVGDLSSDTSHASPPLPPLSLPPSFHTDVPSTTVPTHTLDPSLSTSMSSDPTVQPPGDVQTPSSSISSHGTPPLPASKPVQRDSSTAPSSSSQQSAMAPLVDPPSDEVPTLQGISPECMVELEKLCEGVEPGGARRKCFKENEEKLSPACQRAFDRMAARIAGDMQHFRAACRGDVKQFCPQVGPGGGSILQCLEENYKEVSENCYQVLKQFQKMKAGRSL